MATYIYARFSPRPDAEDCKSIDVQVDCCERYCRMHDFEVSQIFVDRETSARKIPFIDREGGGKLWRSISHGDRIVCARLDRAFRSSSDGHRMFDLFAESNIEIHFVAQDGCSLNNKTATGKLLLSMSLAVAEYEPMVIAERTKTALQHKRSKMDNTFATCKIPFGYCPDYSSGTKDGSEKAKKLMFCEEEIGIIKLILTIKDVIVGERRMSYNGITESLNEQKVPCRGRKWSTIKVIRICKAWKLNAKGQAVPNGQES